MEKLSKKRDWREIEDDSEDYSINPDDIAKTPEEKEKIKQEIKEMLAELKADVANRESY